MKAIKVRLVVRGGVVEVLNKTAGVTLIKEDNDCDERIVYRKNEVRTLWNIKKRTLK